MVASDIKYVPDTSVIIDGEVSRMLNDGEISNGDKIVIPIAVLDELQSQASSNKEHGIAGLLKSEKNVKRFMLLSSL